MTFLPFIRNSLLLLSVFLIAAANLYPVELTQPQGDEVYDQYCKNCHRNKGRGFFKLYPPLDDPTYLNNDSLMVAIITQGLQGPIEVNGKEYNREMAAIAGITNAEISAVVNYMRKEFIQSTQKLNPQTVQKWRQKLR